MVYEFHIDSRALDCRRTTAVRGFFYARKLRTFGLRLSLLKQNKEDKTMNFEEFKEKLTEDLKQALYEQTGEE